MTEPIISGDKLRVHQPSDTPGVKPGGGRWAFSTSTKPPSAIEQIRQRLHVFRGFCEMHLPDDDDFDRRAVLSTLDSIYGLLKRMES